MRKWIAVGTILAGALTSAAAVAVEPILEKLGGAASLDLEHDSSTVNVRISNGTDPESLPPQSRRIFGNWHSVPVRAFGDVASALATLSNEDWVEVVELNLVHKTISPRPDTETPRDGQEFQLGPSISHRLVFPNDFDPDLQWNLDYIQMPAAWEVESGGGATVAVIDSGVAQGGLDLACTTFVHDYDAFFEISGPGSAAFDVIGHGTHVAGTVAQCTNNNFGVAGVAHGARIMPIITSDPVTNAPTTEAVARGIVWAADHAADVINLSLGRPCDAPWPQCSVSIYDDAIDYALLRDVVMVASNGNDQLPFVEAPANHPGVIAVSASDLDTLAPYSNVGQGTFITAPGGNKLEDLNADGFPDGIFQETLPVAASDCASQASFVICPLQGTSMAAPHVAGVAGLLRSRYPSATVSQVAQALAESALDVGDPGYDLVFGYGLLQAHSALIRLGQIVNSGGGGTDPCVEDLENGVTCLLEGRFEAKMTWTNFDSTVKNVTFKNDTERVALGYFGGPANVTVIVKALPACSLNGHNWIWLGGFTAAGWDLTIRDTFTGQTKTYHRDPGPDLPTTLKDDSTFPCS